MMSTNLDNVSADWSPEAAKEMSKYGIIRVPSYYCHIGPYRYTNLAGAVSEAKRQKLRG